VGAPHILRSFSTFEATQQPQQLIINKKVLSCFTATYLVLIGLLHSILRAWRGPKSIDLLELLRQLVLLLQLVLPLSVIN
jgi:hypothetical protein